ncbi:MAG TPA: hypothetical protein VNO79_01745 [Actinomycetota bacterium]|nr:hypothetical protein [Actinomycetota bacterium]
MTATIPLPDFGGQFFAGGSLWIVEQSALVQVDPASAEVVGTRPLPAWARGPVVGTDSAIWALVGDEVVQVDPSTMQQTGAVVVGGARSDLAVGAGAVWVADSSKGTVARIDPASLRLIASVPIPCQDPDGCMLTELAADNEGAWVAQLSASLKTTVYRVDPATNEVVASIAVPSAGGEALAVGSGSVWAVAMGVQRIDPSTDQVVADIGVPGIEPVGGSFHGEAVFAAGSLWVLDEEGGLLWEIDPATNALAGRLFPFGSEERATGLVGGPTAVWVATTFGNPQASPPPPGTGAEVARVEP